MDNWGSFTPKSVELFHPTYTVTGRGPPCSIYDVKLVMHLYICALRCNHLAGMIAALANGTIVRPCLFPYISLQF